MTDDRTLRERVQAIWLLAHAQYDVRDYAADVAADELRLDPSRTDDEIARVVAQRVR